MSRATRGGVIFRFEEEVGTKSRHNGLSLPRIPTQLEEVFQFPVMPRQARKLDTTLEEFSLFEHGMIAWACIARTARKLESQDWYGEFIM